MTLGPNPFVSRSMARLAICCALLLGASRSAAGAADDHLASEPKEDPAYRAAIKDALAEYNARHFEEARILFRRAHDLDPNARTLRGIGMASFELRDYVTAVHALSAALVETRKPLSPDQRSHAQGLLERSRLYVDIYVIKVTPAGATVLIDGHAPDLEPDDTVLLGFGSHNIEVSSPGYVLRTFSVSVRGGEHKELSVTLERKPPARAALGAGLPEAARKPPPFAEPARGSAAPWLIAAGAAGLLAVGAGGYWISRHSQLDSCASPPLASDYCTNRSTLELERNLAIVGVAVGGAAAAALAVVGLLNLTSSPKASSPTRASKRASLSCAPTLSGVVCSEPF
jgi:hypothetical protein